jgi:hypothetical protein
LETCILRLACCEENIYCPLALCKFLGKSAKFGLALSFKKFIDTFTDIAVFTKITPGAHR